jgi:hypothetical protein
MSVVNLAPQRSGERPHTQPPSSGAMLNRVGGQFVDGQDNVLGSGFRQPRLTGTSPHFRSQHAERAGVERQVEDRRSPAWFAQQIVTGHALRQDSARPG